jgi:uncharacterized protein YjbJ (UPF0337 family)
MPVNWDVIKGKWRQLKGGARSQWGQLTDDEWDQIAGDRERLIGKLQERYGWNRERAERDIEDYFSRQTY